MHVYHCKGQTVVTQTTNLKADPKLSGICHVTNHSSSPAWMTEDLRRVLLGQLCCCDLHLSCMPQMQASGMELLKQYISKGLAMPADRFHSIHGHDGGFMQVLSLLSTVLWVR